MSARHTLIVRGASTLSPKYDMAKNPVYQIDCTAAASGKRISATKRRVRWRFGFSNAEALAAGRTGIECRGEEHDVTLVWSLASGKRLVLADGHEVHFSKGKKTEGKFQCSWTMQGNHVIKIVAHAAPPLRATPGWRQFDLILDGQSIFDMPAIYQLGMPVGGATDRGATVVPYEGEFNGVPGGENAVSYNNYSLPREEESHWARTVQQAETRHNMDRSSFAQPPTVQGSDLSRSPEPTRANSLNMPTDLVSEPTPILEMQDHLAAPVALMDRMSMSDSNIPVHAVEDEFSPVAPEPVTQPVQTYENVTNEILGAYDAPQKSEAMVPAPQPVSQFAVSPQQQQSGLQILVPKHDEQHINSSVASPTDVANPAAYVAPTPQYSKQAQFQAQQQGFDFAYQAPQDQPTQNQTFTPLGAPLKQNNTEGQQFVHSPVAGETVNSDLTTPTTEGVAVLPQPPLYSLPTNEDASLETESKESTKEEGNSPEARFRSSINSLCNINDITAEPEQKVEARLTLNPFEDPRETQRKARSGSSSRGLPPLSASWQVGSNASLSDIKKAAPRSASSQEVMRSSFSSEAGAAGSMVVYGQQAPQIQHASGFGAGATMSNGGYAQHKGQQALYSCQ